MSHEKNPPSRQNVVPLASSALRKAVGDNLKPHDGDTRPVLLFLAGPNGAGKSSFMDELDGLAPGRSFIFVNADLIARFLAGVPGLARLAQKMADLWRSHMFDQQVDFATETVFSDEVGAKLQYLRDAADRGFRVVMVYVTLPTVELAMSRVKYRVETGMGHDVPQERMRRRWIASHENLRRALFFVETVIILDNSSAINPLQPLACINKGEFTFRAASMPAHIASLLPSAQELADAHQKKPEANAGTGDVTQP